MYYDIGDMIKLPTLNAWDVTPFGKCSRFAMEHNCLNQHSYMAMDMSLYTIYIYIYMYI